MVMEVLTPQTSNLEFKYFLSSADDELRTDYYTGLNKVLKKYGVDGVVLNTANSLSSEDTIIVLAKILTVKVLAVFALKLKPITTDCRLKKYQHIISI